MRERTTWDRGSARRSVRQSPSKLSAVVDSLNEMVEINQQAMVSVVEGVGRMMMDVTKTMTSSSRSTEMHYERRHRYKHDCDCDECRGKCRHDQCYCHCCVGDVDLIVYTRVNERRVVPLVIENSRRREKEITLNMSEWTSRGGKPSKISAQITQPTSFTLQPCEERQVIIVINVVGGDDTSTDPDHSTVPRRQNLDECEVAYADLYITGCDIRPIRIAVAILPYDCGAYDIDCRCGCC